MHNIATIPVGFISAERPEYTKEQNKQRTEQLKRVLKDWNIAFKPVVGVYNGVKEDSLVVDMTDSLTLVSIAAMFQQEAVLIRDTKQYARMYFTDGKPSRTVGQMVRITANQSLMQDYTYDPSNNSYWGIV